MLVLVNLMVLEIAVAPELGNASFSELALPTVVAEIFVLGFNHPGVLCLEFTGLVFVPDKTGKLGDRGLRIKAVDIANFWPIHGVNSRQC